MEVEKRKLSKHLNIMEAGELFAVPGTPQP
jgi:hypothetical protein